uniref:MD-2-related lipid-recognition domain-containing protein n=1 Tax=Acrobeloides nanus TaxID=290746 RepID=A0A914DRE7_9BILA
MTSHGQLEYPIHLGSKLVTLAFINNRGPAITQIQQDIAIAEWDSSNCKWNTLQTFGFLNNLDGCANGIECPIPQGEKIIKITADFLRFQALIGLLKNDTPYQLQTTLTNKATGDQIVVTVQARAEIH